MTVRQDKRNPRNPRWRFRQWVRQPDGVRVRVFGTPGSYGLPNTRAGATEAERIALARVVAGIPMRAPVAPPAPEKERHATVEEFAVKFMESAKVKNKESSVHAKEQILRTHIIPAFGSLELADVTYAKIDDFKNRLAATPVGKAGHSKGGTRLVKAKTINNVLGVLRRMLVMAKKRGEIEAVPEIEWLKVPQPEVDFLSIDEIDRLAASARGEWAGMMTVAAMTGLRFGEMLALRWQDVDLAAGKLHVARSIVRGIIGTPKSGKPREVPLSERALLSLKRQRHLRGPIVYCNDMGGVHRPAVARYELVRARKKAGLRKIGWHTLRHSFASNLVTLGATLKTVQELLGHATIAMTMRYAHLSPTATRDAVRLLDLGQQAGSKHSGKA